MEYQRLTPEIMVPQEWPISGMKRLFIKICEHLIKLDDPCGQFIFEIGSTTTKLTRSATTPKFTFTKVENK